MSNAFEVEETVPQKKRKSYQNFVIGNFTIRLHTQSALGNKALGRGKSRLNLWHDSVLGHKENGWTLYAPKRPVSPCNCESQCPWTLSSLAVHVREAFANK